MKKGKVKGKAFTAVAESTKKGCKSNDARPKGKKGPKYDGGDTNLGTAPKRTGL